MELSCNNIPPSLTVTAKVTCDDGITSPVTVTGKRHHLHTVRHRLGRAGDRARSLTCRRRDPTGDDDDCDRTGDDRPPTEPRDDDADRTGDDRRRRTERRPTSDRRHPTDSLRRRASADELAHPSADVLAAGPAAGAQEGPLRHGQGVEQGGPVPPLGTNATSTSWRR